MIERLIPPALRGGRQPERSGEAPTAGVKAARRGARFQPPQARAWTTWSTAPKGIAMNQPADRATPATGDDSSRRRDHPRPNRGRPRSMALVHRSGSSGARTSSETAVGKKRPGGAAHSFARAEAPPTSQF